MERELETPDAENTCDCIKPLKTIDTNEEIHSMESKFKEYKFEQLGFSNNTLKCIEFWKLLAQQPIIPAVASTTAARNNTNIEAMVNPDSLESFRQCSCYVWCKALYEMQQRNMDHIALVTGVPKPCKYCKNIIASQKTKELH